MSENMHDRFVHVLRARGAADVPSTSRRFTKLKFEGRFYFVGKSGSLRVGPTASAEHSFPVAAARKREMLDAYDDMVGRI